MCSSTLSVSDNESSLVFTGKRKKGRPRKQQPMTPTSSENMADKREFKRQRKEATINFEQYAQKPGLVARLTKAEEPQMKRAMLERKRHIEQHPETQMLPQGPQKEPAAFSMFAAGANGGQNGQN